MRLRQEDDSYERISRGFREYTGESKGAALVVVLLLLGAALGIVLWGLWQRERSGARRLFRRLADANGLSLAERRLLQAVAERGGEDHLPEIFFRRGLFEEAVAEMAAEPELIDSLRRKVYDA